MPPHLLNYFQDGFELSGCVSVLGILSRLSWDETICFAKSFLYDKEREDTIDFIRNVCIQQLNVKLGDEAEYHLRWFLLRLPPSANVGPAPRVTISAYNRPYPDVPNGDEDTSAGKIEVSIDVQPFNATNGWGWLEEALITSQESNLTFTTTQNYPSLSMCTPIETIVFTSTGNLPVVPSNSGPLKVFNNYNTPDGSISGINSLSSALVPILTDLIVPLDKGWEYKPYILYNPSVYRLMDMNSNNSINNIDIQVFWKSNLTGVLVPIYLDSQCSASMKIMFRRKKFNADSM